MINKLIDLTKEYNEILKSKIDVSKSSNQIYHVLERLGKEPVTEDELNEFYGEISKLDLAEESKSRLPFIVFLLRNNKELDETQNGILYTISKKVSLQDTSSIESLLEKNTRVIDELNNSEIFENMEDLVIVFSELEAANEIEIDNDLKIGVIREIIKKNHENASKFTVTTKEETVVPSDDEYTEHELSEDKKMSEDEIKEILGKYGYTYDLLNPENKKYLLRYATQSKMVEVLEALKNAKIKLVLKTLGKKTAFCKTLVISNAAVINEFVELCKEHSIYAKEIIDEVPSVLIPNKLRKPRVITKEGTSKSSSGMTLGVFNNFKENLKYLSENNYNIPNIVSGNRGSLTVNPEILRYNLEILSDVYKISMTDGKAFTGVISGTAIEKLDRIIESSPQGYLWARDNNSKFNNTTEKQLIQIRIAEARGCSLFYTKKASGIDANGEKISYTRTVKFGKVGESSELNGVNAERLKVLELSKEQLDEEFGRVEPSYLSEQEQNLGFDILVSSAKSYSDDIVGNSFIKLLDENYKVNEFVYRIGTTLISRQKVLRVCQNLKDNGMKIGESEIKYAMAYNSILNEEDIKNIDHFRYVGTKSLSGGRKR